MARELRRTFQVKGAKELRKALEKLEPKFAKKVLRQSLRKGLKPMLAQAKANAPVATGDVKKEIKISAMKRKRNKLGVRIAIGKQNFVGKQFYGAFQEFGWKSGKRGSEGREPIEGKHFLEDAFKSKGQASLEISRTELKKGIDQTARELGPK